jgi:hypothetical protein
MFFFEEMLRRAAVDSAKQWVIHLETVDQTIECWLAIPERDK